MKSLVAAATASAFSVALTLWYCEKYREKPSRPSSERQQKTVKWSQEIIDEQQARTRAFLGEKGLQNIRQSYVVVVGSGGVGSWVATMLVRSGVGRIRIIDFDQVTLSSLNRHACATLADVGRSKVDCLASYLRRVCPWVEIEAINALWRADRAHLLEGADFVVDCIDNIDTKVDLLTHCHRNNLQVISSMGAGCKGDPTRIQIGDISSTAEDPLSRAVRIRLRFRGITAGIPTVFSSEKPSPEKAQLLKLAESEIEKGNVNELSVIQDFRVRILPVLGPVPAIFGLTITTHLLTFLGGYHSVYDPIIGGYNFAPKNHYKFYDAMHRSIVAQFSRMRWPEWHEVPVTPEEIQYLFEDVWRGHTLTGPSYRAKLTVWDPNGPRNIHNMVPLTKELQLRHEDLILKGGKPLEEVYTEEQLDIVTRRMKLDQWYEKWR